MYSHPAPTLDAGPKSPRSLTAAWKTTASPHPLSSSSDPIAIYLKPLACYFQTTVFRLSMTLFNTTEAPLPPLRVSFTLNKTLSLLDHPSWMTPELPPKGSLSEVLQVASTSPTLPSLSVDITILQGSQGSNRTLPSRLHAYPWLAPLSILFKPLSFSSSDSMSLSKTVTVAAKVKIEHFWRDLDWKQLPIQRNIPAAASADTANDTPKPPSSDVSSSPLSTSASLPYTFQFLPSLASSSFSASSWNLSYKHGNTPSSLVVDRSSASLLAQMTQAQQQQLLENSCTNGETGSTCALGQTGVSQNHSPSVKSGETAVKEGFAMHRVWEETIWPTLAATTCAWGAVTLRSGSFIITSTHLMNPEIVLRVTVTPVVSGLCHITFATNCPVLWEDITSRKREWVGAMSDHVFGLA